GAVILGLFVVVGGGQRLSIQLSRVSGLWQGTPVIGAKVPPPSLNAALLMSMVDPGMEKHRLKPPVRTKGNESRRLLPSVSLQNLLHCQLEIVVAEALEYPAKARERQLVRFEKRLLRRPRVRAM